MNAIPVLGDGFVHFSNLRNIAKSPAHYRVACERRLEPTPAMLFGSLVHALILGAEFHVYPKERRGNDWKKFKKHHAGKLIVTRPELDRAMVVAQAARRDPVLAPLLDGEHERGIEWDYLGRRCSSRIDVLGEDHILDLKCVSTAAPGLFRWASLKMGYHAQLSFYRRAAATVRDWGPLGWPSRCYLAGVETQPPFCVTVFRLSGALLVEGDKLNRLWMERLLACEASNDWPGYVQSEVEWDADAAVEIEIDGEPVELAS